MKNLIQSRRGIAIEMAIGAMFIMIALSIVLLSISGMQTQHKNQDLKEFEEKIECYEILDQLIKNNSFKNLGEAEEAEFEVGEVTYSIKKSDNNEYTVIKDENVVLIVVTDSNGTITSWGK